MQRKIIFLLLVILSVISFNRISVKAQPSNANFYNGNYIYGTYVKKVQSNGVYRYETARFLRRSDGQFAYCIQPFIEFIEGKILVAYDRDYEIVAHMTRQQIARIKLLSYYGYGYGNHVEDKWYIITQMMIWKTVDPTSDFYFTETLDGGRISIYENEMAEIEQLIANHSQTPTFDGNSYDLSLGQSITLNDEKGVLSQFSIVDSSNITASINGNSLNIVANAIGSGSITLAKLDTKYPSPPIVYVDGAGQDLFVVGSHDPVYSNININVVAGKIKIKKVDRETNNTKPQGGASLVGAIYNVYDSNNNIVSILTIGADGTATTDYLPLGTYTIREKSPSTGYTLDNTVYHVNVQTTDIIEVIVYEDVVKGRIEVKKVDSETNICKAQGGATLVGAQYGIYDKNNNLVETLTIGNDCSATSKYLPYGNYQIREIRASTGYKVDSKPCNVKITSDQTVDITSKEEVIKGRIEVKKVDSETNTCRAQGQATLVGAKYGVYDLNNNLVDTLIIGQDCTAVSKPLPYGNYKIKEIEATDGYHISTKVYSQFISEELNYPIVDKEDIVKNFISILKQYDYVDGNTTFLNAEANITFEIYYPNGELYDTIVTDQHGYATIEIPYGVWKFHQVNTSTGFEKIYDFYITVDKNSEKEQYYNILNNKLSAYLQVIKVDSETGKTIALEDTTFKILNTDTNQFVSQYVGGKVYSEFKTDKDGKFITYLKLDAGNYKLIETSNPNGYLIDPNGIEFTIGDDTHYNYTNYGVFVTVQYENKPIKGVIEIHKKGENVVIENGNYKYEEIPLDNVVFEIYANEDILSSDKNHLYYTKDQLVDTITTDLNGYAISKALPLGNYYIIEVKTKDSHVLNMEKYEFTLSEIDNRTPIVYHSYSNLNVLKKGTLEFTKKDLSTGEEIPNTTIEIYHISGDETAQLVFKGLTDKDGKIVIKNLFAGKFKIVETDPATGYLLNNEITFFEIKDDGEIVKATMTNEKIKSKVIIHKIDTNSNPIVGVKFGIFDLEGNLLDTLVTNEKGIIEIEKEYGSYYYQELETIEGFVLNNEKVYFDVTKHNEIIETTITNNNITGTLEFTKTDLSTGEPLPNTLIEIYNAETEELVFSDRTDDYGKIIIENLEYGKYYITEREAPVGYILNDERMYFEIKEYGEVVKATMTNEKIEMPNTYNTDIVYLTKVCLTAIVGIGLLVYAKKR